jgi:hypothetical protein
LTQTHSKTLTARRKKKKTAKLLAAEAKQAKKLGKTTVKTVSADTLKKVSA